MGEVASPMDTALTAGRCHRREKVRGDDGAIVIIRGYLLMLNTPRPKRTQAGHEGPFLLLEWLMTVTFLP